MPELPEVETIRLFLQKYLPGKTLTAIDIREPRQFHGKPKELIGTTIKSIGRTGKVLHIELTSQHNSLFLSIHLKLSGQILYAAKPDTQFKNMIPRADTNTMPAKTTRIILQFNDESALYFNDMRKFGWIKCSEKPEEPLGIDVLSPAFTYEYFQKAIAGTRRPIKVVLLDQDRMAGIGNIYANDSLWQAKIHPGRSAHQLSDAEQKRVFDAIIQTIHEGIKYKGSSAQDELYVLPDSEKGQYQYHFKTYHQHNSPCKRCGDIIQRIVIGGRGTFFCAQCQV